METYATAEGEVVIPSSLRRKYGIKAGTKLLVFDDGERIILKPVTEQYLKGLQGALKGKGALKVLLQERSNARERE